MAHEILVTLTRSNREESHHYGAYCVWRDGEILRRRGDIETPVFLRSAAKPFQAIAVIDSGAPERFGFSDAEVALVCASHSGSPRHAQTAESMFSKMGESPELLRCGGHRPLSREVDEEYVRRGIQPGRLEDNCSGKHAGMIAAAKARGEDVASYADPDHPLQRDNRATFALFCGVPADGIEVGVDGCAVPSFGVPVAAMARAIGRFTTPDELPGGSASAARRLTGLMLAHPEMVGGAGRLDTELMRIGEGRLIAKSGAEGVQLVGVCEERLGIAVKIDDGAQRARHAVTCALLIDLGLVASADVAGLFPRQVMTREGTSIGEVKVRL